MSWICPYCGTENYQDPLNSRHYPECVSCGEDFITPEKLEAQIEPQIDDLREILDHDRCQLQNVRDHISSLQDEIAGFEIEKDDLMKEIISNGDELKKLENFKIFREVDRVAKARLDVRQKTLSFCGVPG